MSHPSEGTTIPDELCCRRGKGNPTKQERSICSAVTTGPVEQQLVNIASALYNVEQRVEKRMDTLEQKMDTRMDSLERIYCADSKLFPTTMGAYWRHEQLRAKHYHLP